MAKTTQETVCVTGGAGFIGSHVTDALLAAGHRVLVLDDLSSGRRENLPAGAELHVLDIRSPEAARLVETAGVSVLAHFAAQMDVRRSVADPVFDADVNVLGSLKLFEACRKGGVRQVLFASTGGAIYGEQDVFPATEEHPARPVDRSSITSTRRPPARKASARCEPMNPAPPVMQARFTDRPTGRPRRALGVGRGGRPVCCARSSTKA